MNWKSKTIWTGDNLYIMRGMNSASVDLIYLDPPFNSKANYSAPIGSAAAGAAFKDTWSLEDVDVEWSNLIEAKHPALYRVLLAAMTDSDKSYLIYMAVRILEMRRILKPTGSIYLHCDPTMSHYLKLVMDAVFGRRNFRNEIIWRRTGAHGRAKRWGPIHDCLLFYTANDKWTWNRVLEAYDSDYIEKHYRNKDQRGQFQPISLTGPGIREGSSGMLWRDIDPAPRHWELPPDRSLPDWFDFPEGYSGMNCQQRLDVLDAQSLIYWPPRGTVPRFKRYIEVSGGNPLQDLVLDIRPLSQNSKERLSYPTQKPLALLDRLIRASSNEGDVVFDPFCGCATTLVAAEELGRQWAGIDISKKAVELIISRIEERQGLWSEIIHRTDIPKRNDLGKLPPYRSHAKALYGEQGGTCNGCKDHHKPELLEVDHIVSRKKGGTDHIENLQLLCGNCNKIKGDRGMEYLMMKLQMRDKMVRSVAS